jgi:hypothetical protein
MAEHHWRDIDYNAIPDRPNPRRWLWRAGAPLTLASMLVVLVAMTRDENRCRQSCYGSPPKSYYGFNTYEPGHHWTSYVGSWQWSAQIGIAYIACLLALIGLALAVLSTRRSPVLVFVLSALLLLGWLAWVLLSPAG